MSSLSVVSAVRARRAATSLWARATLGRALSLAGTAVSETQQRLTAVAAASGARDARIVVLPTALMIAFGRAGWATIESIPQLAGALRLDQISALYELVDEAERARSSRPRACAGCSASARCRRATAPRSPCWATWR